MGDKRIRIFFLPFNRDVLLGVIGVIILISFGVINFNQSQSPASQSVFTPQVKPYYHGPTDKQQVALKINVAWGEEQLPEILDILDEYEATATFFFAGKWVKKFPKLTQEVKKRGHELGNHGFKHAHPTQLSREELTELIKKNERLIKETTGYQTNLFAPPYGEVNDKVVKTADEIGYKTVLWSADTIDWQRPAPEVIVNRVKDRVEQGGIILMHPTKPTVKALPEIITNLREKNYKLVTISQLLD